MGSRIYWISVDRETGTINVRVQSASGIRTGGGAGCSEWPLWRGQCGSSVDYTYCLGLQWDLYIVKLFSLNIMIQQRQLHWRLFVKPVLLPHLGLSV